MPPHVVSCSCCMHPLNKIDTLQLLLRRYSLSAAVRVDRLLSLPCLGNGTAVDLMDNMLSLLGSDDGGFMFTFASSCLQYMQFWVTPCLAATDDRGLAGEADQVLLATRQFTV